MSGAESPWKSIDTAPRDGTFIDVKRGDIRFTDCHFDTDRKLFVQEFGYPATLKVFKPQPTEWMERPPGLSDPYTGKFTGKYSEER